MKNYPAYKELKTSPEHIWEGIAYQEPDFYFTVKPVKNDHSKQDETKVLMTNGSLMQVKSITECSSSSILQ